MKTILIAAILAWLAVFALAAEKPAPAAIGESCIVVENTRAEKVVTLSAAELAKLPHAEVEAAVGDARRKYSGVPLAELLHVAGVEWGGKCSPLLTCYVLVESADGYRVMFAIPEVDPQQRRQMVILADRCDGQPLSAEVGPYETIEADAKERGRWVKHVKSISLQVAARQRSRSHERQEPAVAHTTGEPGKIYLAGMGPGDAELVTFKAAKALKEADCVFCFDYLEDEVARYAPAAKITVAAPLLMGRAAGRNPAQLSPEMRKELEQSKEEHARFVTKVRKFVAAGKTVVFADAGDPTIYCPWSWITEEFADLRPTVVPGLSSFNAANAALVQSITRNSGSVLISAGEDLGMPDKNGRLKTTLVSFTHRAKLKELAPRLLARYPADTPAAVVCEASYPTQRVVWATLGTLLEKTADQRLPHLYLVYVGDGLKAPAPSVTAAKHD